LALGTGLGGSDSSDVSRIPCEYRQLIKEYCSAVEGHFGENLTSICVFGSVARGEATATSDIDVLVIARGLPSDAGLRTRQTNLIHMNLKKTPAYRSLRSSGRSCLISDIFFTPSEVKKHPPILLDIVEDGVILYDKEGFLANVLKSLKEKLKKAGARKVVTEKGYYWILKPDIKPPEVVEI